MKRLKMEICCNAGCSYIVDLKTDDIIYDYVHCKHSCLLANTDYCKTECDRRGYKLLAEVFQEQAKAEETENVF